MSNHQTSSHSCVERSHPQSPRLNLFAEWSAGSQRITRRAGLPCAAQGQLFGLHCPFALWGLRAHPLVTDLSPSLGPSLLYVSLCQQMRKMAKLHPLR